MNTEQFIYSHEYVSARIYSFLKFKKYMKSLSEIICEEMQENEEIIDVNMSPDGKTVWVSFKDSEFGFDSALLWDKDVRKTVQKYLGHDSDTT